MILLCRRHSLIGCLERWVCCPRLLVSKQNNCSFRILINQKQYKCYLLPIPLVNQYRSISTTITKLFKNHTTKGWKKIARDGERPAVYPKPDTTAVACEEGRGAVPHSVLVSELQKCSSVSSQIETFCDLVSITPKDMENRQAFSKSFDEAFSIYFPQFKVNQFGSSVNGLGFKGCDTDICLQTNFNKEEYLILKDVPTLDSVIDGSVSRETVDRMNPLYMLRFVRRLLRRHFPDVREPILLIKARCPILRFYNAKYDVFCDFSCESKNSLLNTKLLRLLINLDQRFVSLAKVIRYWGKYGGFVGDIDMFNSYSFSLLVVHFLQCTNPPVLPSIKEALSKSEYLQYGAVDDTDLLQNDLKKFSASENSKTVEELLKELYFYYLKFDFSRVMLPYTSSTVHISEFMPEKNSEDEFTFNAVNVQDPFLHSFNATCAASFKICKRFMNGLVEACGAYQNDSTWIPGSEKWGVSSLFLPPISESSMSKRWKENRIHSIEMQPIPGVVEKLKKVFAYGLLFQCKEFYFPEDSSGATDSKQILKLQCRAYSKTWQGRDRLKQSFLDNNGHLPLELEHLISTNIASKTEGKKQISCEFLCECFEIRKNNDRRLVLKLSFTESKNPPIVALFLRQYLPSMLQEM